KYAAAGNLAGSAKDLGQGVADSKQFMESVSQSLDGWFPAVLGADAVAFTAPYRFNIGLKGRAQPLIGTGVISGVVQRRQGAWHVIQYHESFDKQDEVLAAYATVASGAAVTKR